MAGDLHRRKGSESTTTSEATEANGPQPEIEKAKPKLDKSGLYDLQQVKRLLDDEVIAFMEDQGYIEAVLVSNIKIIAGSVAVAAAVYSHFGPGEFPANKPVVFACVALYFFCVSIINIFSFIFESSAIFVGKLSNRAKQVSKGALAPNLWIFTSIGAKGTSEFRVEIRNGPRAKKDAISSVHPYEKYITEEGRFLTDAFRTDLKETISKVGSDSKKRI